MKYVVVSEPVLVELAKYGLTYFLSFKIFIPAL